MKWSNTWMLLVIAWCAPGLARAQLEITTNATPQCVFFGEARNISVTFHNPGGKNFEGDIRTRIFQTSSATAALISETTWKRIQVPTDETVVASALLDFPAVKAETKFLVRWLEDSNVIGTTEVFVYPTNLLAELKPLSGEEPLGIFDPQNQLKPLLKNLQVDFVNLENLDLENFSGSLAIIGPFQSKAQMREGLANQIKALAKKGAAVVWFLPPREPSRQPALIGWERERLQPSFYSVALNTNAVVVVQPELVANLPDNPQSQLNLIYFCKLALRPQLPVLPDLSAQP